MVSHITIILTEIAIYNVIIWNDHFCMKFSIFSEKTINESQTSNVPYWIKNSKIQLKQT